MPKHGPTVYAKMMENATLPGIDELRANIEGRVSHTAGMLAEELADIVRHAYVEGMRDGYAQGVAAASGAARVSGSGNPQT